MWNECVIDATMGAHGGLLCFCPVERGPDGEIDNIVIGANFIGSPPVGCRIVGVVHEDGQEAVEAFYEVHKGIIDEALAAQGIEARSAETERLGPKDESPTPQGCAQDKEGM